MLDLTTISPVQLGYNSHAVRKSGFALAIAEEIKYDQSHNV